MEYIREAEIPIFYDGVEITRRRADFVVWDGDDSLILEVKAAGAIKPEDKAQCYLYMKNGGFRVCLIANFGQFPVRPLRLVFSPDRAPPLYGPQC